MKGHKRTKISEQLEHDLISQRENREQNSQDALNIIKRHFSKLISLEKNFMTNFNNELENFKQNRSKLDGALGKPILTNIDLINTSLSKRITELSYQMSYFENLIETETRNIDSLFSSSSNSKREKIENQLLVFKEAEKKYLHLNQERDLSELFYREKLKLLKPDFSDSQHSIHSSLAEIKTTRDVHLKSYVSL